MICQLAQGHEEVSPSKNPADEGEGLWGQKSFWVQEALGGDPLSKAQQDWLCLGRQMKITGRKAAMGLSEIVPWLEGPFKNKPPPQ